MRVVAVLLGVALAGVVAWVVWPRALGRAPRPEAGSSAQAPYSSSEPPGPVRLERAIRAPRTVEEEVREQLSEKRLPYFRQLRRDFPDLILRFGVTEAPDTLDLVIARDDNELIQRVVQYAVSPNARDYGFRRVNIYVPAPEGALDPFVKVAEATVDDAGNWRTWKK